MGFFRMIKVASFTWGAYRTYRRYRTVVRANARHAKTALKRARRSL